MRISFRLTLLAVLVGLVLATAASIGWISYQHGRTTAEVLSGQLHEQTSHRVEQRVDHLVARADAQASSARRLLEAEILPPDDLERVARYFAEVLATDDSLSYLSFGREDTGAYTHAYRDRDGEVTIRFLRPEEGGALALEDYRPGPDGELELLRREDDRRENDPRQRPYYRAAAEAGEDVWTETYVFIGEEAELDSPGVTRAAPVRGEGGELAGVVSADFELLALSRYLAELELGERGYAFLLEHREDESRRVIAHPRPDLVISEEAEDPVRAGEIGDPAARALAARAPTAIADLPDRAPAPAELDAEGEGYLGSVRRMGRPDLDWGIAVLIPERDVMGPVIASRDDTLKAGILAILATVAAAVWLASRMAHSLKALAQETEAVGRMEFEPKPRIASALVEIDRLGAALEEMKTGLRSFQKFVPDDLVRTILRSGEEATLGSDRREVTVYFSDIAGFTPMAEGMRTDELAALLSEYLGAMTRAIHAQSGTVDKYIGDGIMAFWNAPETVGDHARRAVDTAVTSQERLAALRESWLARGLPRVEARIGIHTGEVAVGNFGSERRFEYTVIGDAVNTAARLESLCGTYGVEILISEETRRALGDAFAARPIDYVSVRGKQTGVRVYEVLGRQAEVTGDARARIEAYEAALELYSARRFEEAAAAWEAALARWPHDRPAEVMASRARELAAAPPPPDWDGVHRMRAK